ncbi:MAG: hypothetical protein CSYNP_03496 [Syntrophus sp. SKADARSKE-3]|nr:hypothetical protein [Syntrophus sp. SKADARSKE-3]
MRRKQPPLKIRISVLICVLIIPLPSLTAFAGGHDNLQTLLVGRIPIRLPRSMTGTEFAQTILTAGKRQREESILKQLLEGNLPDRLRILKPVKISYSAENGKGADLTIFVMPDYLSVGSDRDYILVPMGLHTALAVADTFGFILPTKKIVDIIFRNADCRMKPAPLPAGPLMRSTAYYQIHNRMIRDQSHELSCSKNDLVSGHKKDVVLTNRLNNRQGKIAIYGWHRPSGIPIQSLSTVHGAEYADYSHGIRLVSETVLHDGKLKSIYDILEHPGLANILSDEGAIPKARRIMTLQTKEPPATAHPNDLKDKNHLSANEMPGPTISH